MIELQPMAHDAIAAALASTTEEFVAELMSSGADGDDARRHARRRIAEAFPNGRPAPGHVLYAIIEDGDRRGHAWLGPSPDGRPGCWWLWDIHVDRAHRGRGIGRAALELALEDLERRGAAEIGLNVFGRNRAAWQLYESLGFEITSALMRKVLRPG